MWAVYHNQKQIFHHKCLPPQSAIASHGHRNLNDFSTACSIKQFFFIFKHRHEHLYQDYCENRSTLRHITNKNTANDFSVQIYFHKVLNKVFFFASHNIFQCQKCRSNTLLVSTLLHELEVFVDFLTFELYVCYMMSVSNFIRINDITNWMMILYTSGNPFNIEGSITLFTIPFLPIKVVGNEVF